MTPKPDLDAIERRLLPYDVIPHGPQDDGSLLLCFNDDGDTDVGAAWGRHRDAFADYVASSRTDLRALLAEVREARKERNELRALQAEQQRAFVAGLELATQTATAAALAAVDAEIGLTEHVGILRALGNVRARIKQSAAVVGVATTVPDETLRAHEPAPCPGCAGDLAGLVDAVCPTCRAALTVAFAPGEVPRG